jgi:hypothetical protein
VSGHLRDFDSQKEAAEGAGWQQSVCEGQGPMACANKSHMDCWANLRLARRIKFGRRIRVVEVDHDRRSTTVSSKTQGLKETLRRTSGKDLQMASTQPFHIRIDRATNKGVCMTWR